MSRWWPDRVGRYVEGRERELGGLVLMALLPVRVRLYPLVPRHATGADLDSVRDITAAAGAPVTTDSIFQNGVIIAAGTGTSIDACISRDPRPGGTCV